MTTDRAHSLGGSPITLRLVFGLLLIFVGVVFACDQMGWLEADSVLQFWPVIVIAIGASKILWPQGASSRLSGLILVAVGAWLQLNILDYFYYSVWDFWPLLLVLIGLRIVWRGLGGERRTAPIDDASTVGAIAIMGIVNRTSNTAAFSGGDLMAFMGGCEIDLRQARIADGPATIDAFAFWGGIEIKVPADWTVIVKGVPLLGGYEDNTRPRAVAEEADDIRQELIVKGFAIMGGVEVKN